MSDVWYSQRIAKMEYANGKQSETIRNRWRNERKHVMTAQIGENLIYQGRKVSMCSEPLGDYFAFGGEKPDFADNCTSL